MKAKKLTKAREDAHKARTAKNRAIARQQETRDKLNTLKLAMMLIHQLAKAEGTIDQKRVLEISEQALERV